MRKTTLVIVIVLIVTGLIGIAGGAIVGHERLWSSTAPSSRIIPEPKDDFFRLVWMKQEDVGWAKCEDLVVSNDDQSFYMFDGADISYHRQPEQDVKITMGSTGRIYATCYNPDYKWRGVTPNESWYYFNGLFEPNSSMWRIYFRQAKASENYH